MKKRKLNITSLFYLDESILNKDFFLVPLFLAKHLNADFNFVYPKNKDNENYPSLHRGANLIPITSDSEFNFSLWKERQSIFYIIRNARKIDVLFLVWLNHRSLVLAFIYKLLNPKGFCFIKGDMNLASFTRSKSDGIFSKIKSLFRQGLQKRIDILTCETEGCYRSIKSGALGLHLSKVVYHLPNGFDEDTRKQLNVGVKSFQEKENIILVVGRIGADCKNHEMILKALNGLDLANWSVIFVGNIEPSFQTSMQLFFSEAPYNREKVKFVGPKYDKKELWNYYNSAKVFLLSSDKEGFPNVFPEALRFGCFIISTDVEAAFDVTKNGSIGKIIKMGDVDELRCFLRDRIFNNSLELESFYPEIIRLFEERFEWARNIDNLVITKFAHILK